jgi:hypothetical protein
VRAEDILRKRRDRTIAIVLSVKEREIDPLLTGVPGGARASTAMRKVILDQVNDFYDMALDVASSSGADTFEFNPDVWSKRIEGQLRDVTRAVQDLASQNGNRG